MTSSFGTNPTKNLLKKGNKSLAVEGITFDIRGGSNSNDKMSTALKVSGGLEDEETAKEAKEADSAVGKTGISKFMGPKATPPGFIRRQFPRLPWHTLPDLLTYVRCAAIPGLIVQ